MPFSKASASHYHGIEWVSVTSLKAFVQLYLVLYCINTEYILLTVTHIVTSHITLCFFWYIYSCSLKFKCHFCLHNQVLSGQSAVLGTRSGLCKTPVPFDSVWNTNYLLQGALCSSLRTKSCAITCFDVRTRKCTWWRDSAECRCGKTQAKVMGHGNYWRLPSQEVWRWVLFFSTARKYMKH